MVLTNTAAFAKIDKVLWRDTQAAEGFGFEHR